MAQGWDDHRRRDEEARRRRLDELPQFNPEVVVANAPKRQRAVRRDSPVWRLLVAVVHEEYGHRRKMSPSVYKPPTNAEWCYWLRIEERAFQRAKKVAVESRWLTFEAVMGEDGYQDGQILTVTREGRRFDPPEEFWQWWLRECFRCDTGNIAPPPDLEEVRWGT